MVYEDIVCWVCDGKLIIEDFVGVMILLINFGIIGIVYLVLWLMFGQGVIIGVGVMEYFVEF